jgi:hypothetical protein
MMVEESWSRLSVGDDLEGWVLSSMDTDDGKNFSIELAGAYTLAGVSATILAAATLV